MELQKEIATGEMKTLFIFLFSPSSYCVKYKTLHRNIPTNRTQKRLFVLPFLS